MFNLDAALSEWRRQMLAAGIKTPVPLNELEMHLREEIEHQVESGIDARKAFGAATQKIGQAYTLRNEFNKVGGKSEDMKQKLMRIYFVIFPILYSVMGLYGLLKMEMHAALRMLGFIAVALSVFSIWYAPQAHKHLPNVLNRKARLTIQIAPLLLWMVCAGVFMNSVLPRLNLTQGQLVVTVLWLMMQTALMSSLGYGLGDDARRENATAGS